MAGDNLVPGHMFCARDARHCRFQRAQCAQTSMRDLCSLVVASARRERSHRSCSHVHLRPAIMETGMTILVALFLAIVSPPSAREVAAFRTTAPTYLTLETAAMHLLAARAAGVRHRVRPELLLSIAHHESRYIPTTRTPEPGNRESCGVMTPVPKRRCSAHELTVLVGYDIGAEHLRTWLNHCKGSEVCALLSYAGGSGLVRACAHGSFQTSHGTNACDLAYEFLRRAAVIRREVTHNDV